MRDYIGDILFAGFVIVLLIIFLRDWQAANALISGVTTTYTGAVTSLANLGGKATVPAGTGGQ